MLPPFARSSDGVCAGMRLGDEPGKTIAIARAVPIASERDGHLAIRWARSRAQTCAEAEPVECSVSIIVLGGEEVDFRTSNLLLSVVCRNLILL